MIIVILLVILFSIFFAALAITSLICWVSGAIFSWSAVVLVWLILLIGGFPSLAEAASVDDSDMVWANQNTPAMWPETQGAQTATPAPGQPGVPPAGD